MTLKNDVEERNFTYQSKLFLFRRIFTFLHFFSYNKEKTDIFLLIRRNNIKRSETVVASKLAVNV